MKKILIADDHVIVRTGLILLIKEELGQVETDECRDGEGARKKIQNNEYDLIILDNILPKKEGIEVLREIRENGIAVPVLVLSVKSEAVKWYSPMPLNLEPVGKNKLAATDIRILVVQGHIQL